MSSIFDPILTGGFSVGQYLLCLLFAGLCGAVAALALGRESASSRSTRGSIPSSRQRRRASSNSNWGWNWLLT